MVKIVQIIQRHYVSTKRTILIDRVCIDINFSNMVCTDQHGSNTVDTDHTG